MCRFIPLKIALNESGFDLKFVTFRVGTAYFSVMLRSNIFNKNCLHSIWEFHHRCHQDILAMKTTHT